MAKEKVIDKLPDEVYHVMVDLPDDDLWSNTTRIPTAFNDNHVVVKNALDQLYSQVNQKGSEKASYYYTQEIDTSRIIDEIKSACNENITTDTISYYCAFLNVMDGTYIKLVE